MLQLCKGKKLEFRPIMPKLERFCLVADRILQHNLTRVVRIYPIGQPESVGYI